jgi:hypothetical protein
MAQKQKVVKTTYTTQGALVVHTAAPVTALPTVNTLAGISGQLTANIAQQLTQPVPAAHVKAPAVTVVNGQFTNAAGVAVVVPNATALTGSIPASNPALRGAPTNGSSRKFAANTVVVLNPAKPLPIGKQGTLTAVYNAAIAALFTTGKPVTFSMVAGVCNNAHASYVLKPGNAWLLQA